MLHAVGSGQARHRSSFPRRRARGTAEVRLQEPTARAQTQPDPPRPGNPRNAARRGHRISQARPHLSRYRHPPNGGEQLNESVSVATSSARLR